MSDGEILGVSRRTYNAPGWVPVPIIVVLVGGHIGDYAAYISAGDSPEWTKRHGDKLSFEEACIHFPNSLKAELYRK
jgi:hypothetical protein